MVVEGPTLVAEALTAGIKLREGFAAPGTDPTLVAAMRSAGATVREVSLEVLARSLDSVTPQGVAAVADRPEIDLASAVAAAARGPLALVLVDVADPGNAGTLLRVSEAAGAAAVLFCGSSVDPCNPKCVRASAGALFHVPVATGGDPLQVLDDLEGAGVPTAATVVRGGRPYDELDLTGPLALILGSEAHGLDPSVSSRVDHLATIPMEGRSESLNVAMAGAVLCFESLRQRRGAR